MTPHTPGPIAMAVLESAAAAVGATAHELLSKRRQDHIVEGRRLAIKALRQPPHSWSSQRIGWSLGIHHSSVLYLAGSEQPNRDYTDSPESLADAAAELHRRLREIAVRRASLHAEADWLNVAEDRLKCAIQILINGPTNTL